MDSEERYILGMSAAWFAGILIAAVLIAGLVVGGWRAGWWFANQNTNLETHMLHNSYSYQSATQSDLQQKIADITTETTQMAGISPTSLQWADLHAQRLGEARLACEDATQLTADYLNGPAGEGSWVKANCLAGAVSPTSTLEK